MRPMALGLASLVSLVTIANAEAGECYRRVVDPAQYQTVEEQVLISPERAVPEYVPAVVREVEESYVVRPEHEVSRTIAAEYGYEDETVLVSPPHRVWELRDVHGEEVGCWVTFPAAYSRRTHRVLLQPEREVTQTIPAVTETRVRTVVIEPARNYERLIPARYGVRERTQLVSQGGAHWAPASDVCAN